MRYNQTERLGVVETDLIVTKKLRWIFREQPIVDVGIDGLIEESDDQNPTGKFLSVQIKSGESHFHKSSDFIVYYVSNIHYHYWLNLDLPIILIAHFPEKEQTYWQQINKKNLKRTQKRWKIEIPLNQKFDENAKAKLTKLLYDRTNNHAVLELFKGRVSDETIYDIVEDTECIGDSADVIIKIGEIITELQYKTDSFNTKLRTYVEQEFSDKSPQVIAGIKGFSKDLNITSRRLEREIDLYTELYSQGFFAFEQMSIISYKISKRTEEFDFALSKLKGIPKSIDYALEGIKTMRIGIAKLPTKFSALKASRNLLLEVVDMILSEFSESKSMTEKIESKLKTLK
jgi:hypothetical protein